jgi:hypothetical protein
MPDDLKITVFIKNQTGESQLAYEEQITSIFLVILHKKSVLCVKGEYAKLRKKYLN